MRVAERYHQADESDFYLAQFIIGSLDDTFYNTLLYTR